MKKSLLLFMSLILIIGLSSCAKETEMLALGSFSYEDIATHYKDGDAGVNPYPFVNVDKYPIDNQKSALDRATNECTIEYNTTSAYYDNETEMWRIAFLMVEHVEQEPHLFIDHSQDVYLDSDGITQLIVYGGRLP